MGQEVSAVAAVAAAVASPAPAGCVVVATAGCVGGLTALLPSCGQRSGLVDTASGD